MSRCWMMSFGAAFVSIAFLADRSGATQGGDKPPLITWETLEARVKSEADNGFAGVVLVARDGKIVLHQAFGLANREKRIAMRPDTILAIGSTPIDFTKAGILLLAERGKLSLSDPITKYFAGVPEDKRSITIQHLMTGRSGLPDFHDIKTDRDPDHSWIDRDEAVRRILGKKLLFKPGESRRHSHSAWGLLAAILEIASKQSYPEFTREHLFRPAGMSDTGFFGEPYPEERMAIGYGPRKDGEINAPPYWGKTSWLVMGSGGQVSTAMDMWRWGQAVFGGKILSKESLKLYGDGQRVLTGGDVYGFEILYAGDNRNCMIVMSNAGSPKRNIGLRKFAQALADLVIERKQSKFMLGVELDVLDDGRLKILKTVPGGAAQRDGLRAGDFIMKAGGKSLGGEPLQIINALLESGETIVFEIERDGKRESVTVKPLPR